MLSRGGRIRCRGGVVERGVTRPLHARAIRVEQLEGQHFVGLHARRVVPAVMRAVSEIEAEHRRPVRDRSGRRESRCRSDRSRRTDEASHSASGVRYTVLDGAPQVHQHEAFAQPRRRGLTPEHVFARTGAPCLRRSPRARRRRAGAPSPVAVSSRARDLAEHQHFLRAEQPLHER